MDDEVSEMTPEMVSKKWSPGYLYILDYGDGKQFKIGITKNNPAIRANQISRGAGMLLPNPINAELVVSLKMDTNPYYLEQLLHMQQHFNHVSGEWFEFGDKDELANLVKTIEPFGELEYYDRWYSYFDSDFVAYLINFAYPVGLKYNKSVEAVPRAYDFMLKLNDDNAEELNKIVSQYQASKKKYPDSFNGVTVSADFRTKSERLSDTEKHFTQF